MKAWLQRISTDGFRIGKTLFSAGFYCQWGGLLSARSNNWTDFTVVHLGLECGTYTGTYWEFTMGLLGLNLTVEIADADSRGQFASDMAERTAEALDAATGGEK